MHIESFSMKDIAEAARLTFDVGGVELQEDSIKFRQCM